MELKHADVYLTGSADALLIVPYGIETTIQMSYDFDQLIF